MEIRKIILKILKPETGETNHDHDDLWQHTAHV